jgi:hypothetical protein
MTVVTALPHEVTQLLLDWTEGESGSAGRANAIGLPGTAP